MNDIKKVITEVLVNPISGAELSRATGVSTQVIHKLRKQESKIGNMTLDNALRLYKYAKSKDERNLMHEMTYSVYSTGEGYKGNPDFLDIDYIKVNNEVDAEKAALELAAKSPDKAVYIFFSRASDGQTGFYNPHGYDFHAVDWREVK
jgi:hypothetical protein